MVGQLRHRLCGHHQPVRLSRKFLLRANLVLLVVFAVNTIIVHLTVHPVPKSDVAWAIVGVVALVVGGACWVGLLRQQPPGGQTSPDL
jgi:hypothetical protein